MATFTKTVEFKAFQFIPEEMKGLDNEAIEKVIVEALNHTDGISSAHINKGTLNVVLYVSFSEGYFHKENFQLKPGEWLTNRGFQILSVIPDKRFREFAIPKS